MYKKSLGDLVKHRFSRFGAGLRSFILNSFPGNDDEIINGSNFG